MAENKDEVKLPMSTLRERRVADQDNRRKEIMGNIQKDYETHGKYQVTRAVHKNIMLIGRTRTGKSTIKSLLVDPTAIPDELTLKSGTKDPLFESFYVHDNKFVLNIIDTPGLFERSNQEVDIRDNETILKTIETCANREITKFHVICFCLSITTGIHQEDIASLKLLADFLGQEVSNNSCLIITRCESKDDQQRENIRNELHDDNHFKTIAPFFQLGTFFSGSLNRDDYNKANDSLYDQFLTISDYRTRLVELFTSDIEPFFISDMIISEVRRTREERENRNNVPNRNCCIS